MLLKYKYIIIIIILIISLIYTIPNLYGEDPVIIINSKTNINKTIITNIIKKYNIKSFNCKDSKTYIIRFNDTETQFSCLEKIKTISNDIQCYLNLLQADKFLFLEKIGAYHIKLELDLRGEVNILIKINTKNNIKTI